MSVEKTSIIIFGFKEKQMDYENYFNCGFIIIRGMTTSWTPSITLCYINFFGRLYSRQNFTSSKFSLG